MLHVRISELRSIGIAKPQANFRLRLCAFQAFLSFVLFFSFVLNCQFIIVCACFLISAAKYGRFETADVSNPFKCQKPMYLVFESHRLYSLYLFHQISKRNSVKVVVYHIVKFSPHRQSLALFCSVARLRFAPKTSYGCQIAFSES